jgi:hypothetical protein
MAVIAAVGSVGCGDHDAPADGPPTCAHTVFLNFDGATVTHSTVDDARVDTSASVRASGATIPAYLSADANRGTKIQTIVDQVVGTLSPFGITIASTRPTAGAYKMIVIGGTPQDDGLAAGVFDLSPYACMNDSDGVAFAFADGYDPNGTMLAITGNIAVGYVGTLNGLPTSTVASDCMCVDGPTCGASTTCTIGGANTPRTPTSCGSGATFDETLAFSTLTCP